MPPKKERELTNKEKAQYILDNGFSNKSLSTLERMSKEELDLIIKLQRDIDKEDINKEDREATRTLISQILDFLNSYKKERIGQEVNPAIRGFINKNTQDLSIVDTKTSGIIGIILIALAGVYVFLDAIIGFDKIKEMFMNRARKPKVLNAPNETKRD